MNKADGLVAAAVIITILTEARLLAQSSVGLVLIVPSCTLGSLWSTKREQEECKKPRQIRKL